MERNLILHRFIKGELDNREAEPPVGSYVTEMKAETDGVDCRGPRPARNQDPGHPPQANTVDKASDSETDFTYEDWQEPLSESGTEAEDEDNDWEETRTPESGVSDLRQRQNQKTSLMTEEQVQKGRKTFGCDVCGKRFTTQGSLKVHMRVHTGEKPFGCDVCGKRFSQKPNLKRHLSIHTGEKPFGCDVCGKRLSQKQHLKTHMRVHTGEKPFGCDVCGKRFSQKPNLKRHLSIHTGEKPFGFDDCGKIFF